VDCNDYGQSRQMKAIGIGLLHCGGHHVKAPKASTDPLDWESALKTELLGSMFAAIPASRTFAAKLVCPGTSGEAAEAAFLELPHDHWP
jgi:hypothetical protein